MMSCLIVATVTAVLFVVREAAWHRRAKRIEARLEYAVTMVLIMQTPEHFEARVDIVSLSREMEQMVLKARATGDLDLANKVMEFQYWANANYDAYLLEGLFRGFP